MIGERPDEVLEVLQNYQKCFDTLFALIIARIRPEENDTADHRVDQVTGEQQCHDEKEDFAATALDMAELAQNALHVYCHIEQIDYDSQVNEQRYAFIDQFIIGPLGTTLRVLVNQVPDYTCQGNRND